MVVGPHNAVVFPISMVRAHANQIPPVLELNPSQPQPDFTNWKKNMSSRPQWKTRRLAARALRVLARHKAADPTLASYETTLIPAAEAFIVSYDQLRVLSARRATEYDEGKAAVDALGRAVRSWAVQIEALSLISGFKSGDFVDSLRVPDDVLSDAVTFMDTLSAHTEVNPDTVPFLDSLKADITAKLETARLEWQEAEAVRTDYKRIVEENRVAEAAVNAQLVAFRKSLANVLGTSHPDHQTLRARRVLKSDPLDGSDAGPKDESTAPAATQNPDALDEPTASATSGEDEVANVG